MLDYRTGGEKDIYKNEYAGSCVWTKENNVFGWGKLIEGQDKELTDEEMIYFSPAVATVEQLKGLPETFMIVGRFLTLMSTWSGRLRHKGFLN